MATPVTAVGVVAPEEHSGVLQVFHLVCGSALESGFGGTLV